MTTRPHRSTVLTDKALQAVTDELEGSRPIATMGSRQKVAPAASGGVAYASSAQLASLAAYVEQITTAARETGWHSPSMIVSLGEVEEEAIVVGVRWVREAYVVEIR